MDHKSRTNENGHMKGNGDDSDDDDDDDDEFFGAQDEGENEFGDMAKHELQARHHRLKTSGFLDAFDESKEELLQEGFEAGFVECFQWGKTLGRLLGKAATQSRLEKGSSNENHHDYRTKAANQLVHNFFAGDFQANRDPGTVGEDLSRLVEETQACLGNDTE